jgi:hypothetical protein
MTIFNDHHLKNNKDFEENMKKIKELLEEQGYVCESEHIYGGNFQYQETVDDIKEWLVANGYEGEIHITGRYDSKTGNVYICFDCTKISHFKLNKIIEEEIERQSSLF